MTELYDTYKDLKACAKVLGDYEKLSVNELADKYCELTDNKTDSGLRDAYFSALILRFWYKIYKLFSENVTLNLSYTDYYDWVVGAIVMACSPENRSWQKDPSLNAQQVINKILATRFLAAAYYESNLQKNQGKHLTVSLDATLAGSDDDKDRTLLETIPDDSTDMKASNDNVAVVVQHYINSNKIIEAIIFDTIAYKDTYKHDKRVVKTTDAEGNPTKYTQHTSEFWPFKVVKELCALTDSYEKYFLSTYSASQKSFEAAFNTLKKANNQKKYKMLDAALADLKQSYASI
jgi:hypothetical protein